MMHIRSRARLDPCQATAHRKGMAMDALKRLEDANALQMLQDHDPALFSDNVDLRQPILQRLGWTNLASKAESRLPLVVNLGEAIKNEGFSDVVLLGMGGSSLAALVLARVIGSAPGWPTLHVLDTTSPVQVTDLLDRLDREKTVVVVSSKSGTTIEPLSLYHVFRTWMEKTLERPEAGKRFIAITDPGSALEQLRTKECMRSALQGPPTVGGRFSALSSFGLAPAAMIGIDVKKVVKRADMIERACQRALKENPAAELAAWIADRHAEGRDKLTIVCTPDLAPFALWAEQLVAESLGKNGVGVIPVAELQPSLPPGYGPDRAVVVLRYRKEPMLAGWAAGVRAEHPVFEILIDDAYDLGGEFVRWEYVVALLGHLLGVNPFDEPDVTSAKRATEAVLAGSVTVPRANADVDGFWLTYQGGLPAPDPAPADLTAGLRHALSAVGGGDYLALLAFLPEDDTRLDPLRKSVTAVQVAMERAVCLELGPRYLHSTGQLHKGGPDTGVFIMVTARDRDDLPIPSSAFTLSKLYRAQAEGDLITLAEKGRRVIRVDLPNSNPDTIAAFAAALTAAAKSL